jgi:hypothetical protein
MFVVMYDLSDMPANHRTFLRQRTMYVPLASSSSNGTNSGSNSNSTTTSSTSIQTVNANNSSTISTQIVSTTIATSTNSNSISGMKSTTHKLGKKLNKNNEYEEEEEMIELKSYLRYLIHLRLIFSPKWIVCLCVNYNN